MKFLFNTDWLDDISECSEAVQLELVKAVAGYAKTGEIPDLSAEAKAIFNFIRREIDFNKEKYDEKSQKRSEAGKAGAEARWKNGREMAQNGKNGNRISANGKNGNRISANGKNGIYEYEYKYDNNKKEILSPPYGVDNKEKSENESENQNLDTPATQPSVPTLSPTPSPDRSDDWKFIKDDSPKEEKPRRKVFRPPDLEEVRAYIAEKGYSVDAEKWWNFYNSKGWMVGRNKMANWHSAVATWQRGNNSQSNRTGYGNNHGTERGEHDRRGGVVIRDFEGKDYSGTF